jgi:hypothetical protein
MKILGDHPQLGKKAEMRSVHVSGNHQPTPFFCQGAQALKGNCAGVEKKFLLKVEDIFLLIQGNLISEKLGIIFYFRKKAIDLVAKPLKGLKFIEINQNVNFLLRLHLHPVKKGEIFPQSQPSQGQAVGRGIMVRDGN